MKDTTREAATFIENISKEAVEYGIGMSGELIGKTLYLKANPACPAGLKIWIGCQVMLHSADCRRHTCSDAPFCVAEISIHDLHDESFDPYEPVDLFSMHKELEGPLDGGRR